MAVFLVTTSGANVPLPDLGIILTHPTVDRDLLLEYTAGDLSASSYLTTAIASSGLLLKLQDEAYSIYNVDATEYFAGLAAESQFNRAEEEEYITEVELAAGKLNSLINVAATGLSITSTAALTKNVYVANSSKFQKWKLAPGDKVVITGGTAAGTYTVDTVTDQNQFKVIESIVNTSATGTLSLYHPTGASRVGIDTSTFTTVSGTNLQSILGSIDVAIASNTGITTATHKSLRDLIHFIDEGPADGFASGAYKETLPSGDPFPTSEIWYTSVAKTNKIVELLITRNSQGIPTSEQWKMYNASNVLLTTVTDTYTYANNIFEISRVRTIT
jgi:hypothetical protein